MIYLVSICLEKLHEEEFVRPVGRILAGEGLEFEILRTKRDFSKIKKGDFVVICGTGILDDAFLRRAGDFSWVRDSGARVLGICGGAHLIGIVFGARLLEKTEIGFFEEDFGKGFLGLSGKVKVYHLHRFYADFFSLPKFEVLGGKVPQAVRHKEKEIYGVLFHPEVRCKEVILNFLK